MAEDCPDGDYLGAYSRFFSEFVARVNPYDQLPVSVSSYNVTEAEIVGEIINVTLQYLNQTQCPASLQAHMVHQVIQEIKSMCKKQPEDCGFKSQEKTYASLKLMQAITGKVNEICTRYLDNSRLALLPPPPSTPLPQVAAGGSKNCRRKMEDRYVVLHDLHTIFGIEDDSIANYYAVFDGHAGQDAAVYCATHLHQYLAESIYYPTDPERALRDAFLTTDTQFVEKSKTQKVCGGTTAVCTIILNKRLYVAWVGDSTAILIKRDNIVQLVNPHRLHREDEVQRIRKTGGVVMQSMGIMRVNGVLSVSRAIGDFRYKPFVTGEPEIKSVLLDGTEDFLVLATDGLTDYLEPGDIATALYHEIQRNPNGFKRAHQILLQWAKQAGSKDNITVVVVLLTPASAIAARPLHAHPYHSLQVNDILEKMNSKDKPLFLGIDDAHNAINSNILKQSMIAQEPRDHEDDGILAASNGKHENGDADYDYSDLGPETDVDAIDDVVAMPVKNLSYDFYKDSDSVHHDDVLPVKNLSYEFYKDTDSVHDDDQPDNVTNVLDNMDLDESGNANINVNANVMHESIAANNLHENDEDDEEDDDDDEDEDEDDDNDNNVHEDNEIREAVDVAGEIAVSETGESVHRDEEVQAHVREVIHEEMDNKAREQLEGNTDDEETQVKTDDHADDALDVVDEAAPLDYDESPPSPQANKPLQHALINEADNVADSEDSEDEWNYYRVDPNKEKDSTTPVDETQEARNEEQTQISEPSVDESELKIQPEGIQEDDIKCKSPQEESPELINTEISAEDKKVESEEEEKPCAEEQAKPKDMDFPLNPNAAEFVPGSPQFVDTRMNLVEDYPVSGSPFKQVSQMDDIQVPSQSEFEKEVSQRPREVEVEEKEYQNGDDPQRIDYADFISDRQKVIGASTNLDDSEISSTKAEYGDESTASFIMTSEFHKTGISTIDESFSSSERDYDIAKDPMAMSFTPSDFEAAFDRGLDLNAVHNLSNTDLEDKNDSMEKEEDLTIEYADLKVDSTNLMSTSDVEEPTDKPASPEEPAKLVNLSFQHEDNENTFIEHAGESKITTVDLLNLRPQSPQMEQQETAKYDHSPSTENYSAEFESEKEPISVDNEQPLSPSSADIDETKPIDEASEDAALPVSDFQKETCSNEADTPSSLSPVPDAMESDLVAPTESAEIQSLLHADAPEFKPGQYSFQSYNMKSSEICQQPSPTETVDVCKTLSTEPALDSYEPYPVETDNAFEPVKQDLAKNLELEEKEVGEPVCAKPPVQESLLDFTEEKDVCTKPPQMQCELTPPLSPQEVEEKVIEDVVCPVESSVIVEQKQEEVIEDKTKEIEEAMKELVEPVKAAESMEAVDRLESLSGRTLNLSDSMQEFTGLENQLQPKEDEIPASDVVEDVEEEVAMKEKLINVTEPEEPAELVIEETCKIQEKMEVQGLPPEVEELEAKEPEVEQFEVKESEMEEPKLKESEFEQFEMMESKVEDVDAMETEIKETEVVKDIEIKEAEFVKEPEIKEMEVAKEPEVKELEIKEPEIKELKVKEPEIKEPEVKESEIKEPEVKEPEIKEPELKEPEVKEPEVKEPEIEVPEVKELGIKEPVVMESEIKEPEIREPDVKESEIEEPKIKEPEIVKPEVKEPEVKEPEVKEPEVKEPEVKESEVEEPEIKEPEVTALEIKEPEVKGPEIKEPEIKEPEVKESEVEKPEIQEPEIKESVEIKEPEVEQKAAEVSENKVVESAAAAAIAATAAVAAGAAVAAQSKAKAKPTSAKPTKTATLKSTAPKSTPTSPSKTTISAARTPTTATKKVSSSTPTRPKDLDAPKKSPAPSTVSSKPSVPKTASKTTTSTATAKPATRLSAGQVSKPKPAASSKPPVADKKPTANGDVKSLSKPAASKPPSKASPSTKTTLVKASTGRMSTGSALTAKPKPASTGTATKPSPAAKSSATATTTSTTTTARPKTAPAVGNATKTRTSTASKPPIIDKQVKETANKQISMSRTSTGATKVTSRLSATSSTTTTTTTKRVTSSPKTTATSPSAKKTISKASKTSTGGKTPTDKGKIVQNGVPEKVQINTIMDDVPKKDLSPMVAPDDNQLIMSSD